MKAPVLRVRELPADVEAHAREIGTQRGCGRDDPGNGVGGRAKLARKRPVAAHIRRIDTQTDFCVRLHGDDLAQFLDAVDHEPVEAVRHRLRNMLAALDRVRIENLPRRNAEAEKQVDLPAEAISMLTPWSISAFSTQECGLALTA